MESLDGLLGGDRLRGGELGRRDKELLLSLFFFLRLHLRHMEVPRLGVTSELQLLAYTTATAMRDLSCIYNLHHNSRQCLIPDPLSEARNQTHILMDTS